MEIHVEDDSDMVQSDDEDSPLLPAQSSTSGVTGPAQTRYICQQNTNNILSPAGFEPCFSDCESTVLTAAPRPTY